MNNSTLTFEDYSILTNLIISQVNTLMMFQTDDYQHTSEVRKQMEGLKNRLQNTVREKVQKGEF
jgi:hypothetical protein